MKNYDYVVNTNGLAGVYYNGSIHIVVDDEKMKICDVETFKPTFALRNAKDVALLESTVEDGLEVMLIEFPELSFNIKENKSTMFVAILQFVLGTKGYNCGSLNGRIDEPTQKQINKFCDDNKIDRKVDKHFWETLLKE